MAAPDVEAAVRDVLGSGGDPTVLEYITSCLDDFDFGDGGEEAFESFGPMMVRGHDAEIACARQTCRSVHGAWRHAGV